MLTQSCHYDFPYWISVFALLLSNDIELIPADQYLQKEALSFCNWNINNLSRENFSCVSLLEAHNSLYNYDIISFCETSLNETVSLPDKVIDNYKNKMELGFFITNHSPL